MPSLIFADFPQLETERLVLRQMRPADADALFAVYSEEEVMRYHDLGVFTSVQQARNLIQRVKERFREGGGIRWGVALRDRDLLIGSCGYHNWEPDASRAELGYALSRAYWGRGLMTEAVRATLAYGFRELHLHRVEATVMPGNDASIRLLKRVGFQREGLMRERGFWKGGFHDLELFSLLKSDPAAAALPGISSG